MQDQYSILTITTQFLVAREVNNFVYIFLVNKTCSGNGVTAGTMLVQLFSLKSIKCHRAKGDKICR
jgi:hypothetical protein